MQACRGLSEQHRIFPGGGWSIPDLQKGTHRLLRQADDRRTSFGLGNLERLERTSGNAVFWMSISLGGLCGGIASVLVHSFFDRARGKFGEVGGNSKFWRPGCRRSLRLLQLVIS